MDNTIEYIKIEDIIPSKFQPHLDNDVEGLAISIQNYGIITPLLVRKNNEKYEIVLGNRRYIAAKQLGLKQLPAIIKKMNDKETIEYMLLDNLQKKNITETELENIVNNLITKYKVDRQYISSNLGIDIKQKEIKEDSQLDLLKEDESKSSIEDNEVNKIKLDGTDIVNLDDLNKRELEREDEYMNNEMNNNINNIDTQLTDPNNPTFGGRFFPSLEDEQTNMNLNTGLTNNINTGQSDLIDLTNLDNEPKMSVQTPPEIQQTINVVPENPSPLPDMNVNNMVEQQITPQPPTPEVPQTPVLDDIAPQQPIAPAEPVQPTPTPVMDIPSSTPMPNLEDLSIPNPLPDMNVNNMVEQPITPQPPTPEVPQTPVLDEIVPQQPIAPAEPVQPAPTPVMDIPSPTPMPTEQLNISPQENFSIPSIDPLQPAMPTTDISATIPTPEPTIPVEQPVAEPTIQEPPAKDITPAINTIKSLVDTISGIGYKISVNENDLGSSYNISINIER